VSKRKEKKKMRKMAAGIQRMMMMLERAGNINVVMMSIWLRKGQIRMI